MTQGKRVYIVDQPDELEEDILVTFYKAKTEKEIQFMLRYETAVQKSELKEYKVSDDVTGTIDDDNSISLTFTEATIGEQIVSALYYVSVYRETDFENIDTVNTIYTDKGYLKQETFEALNDGSQKQVQLLLENVDIDCDVYVNVVFAFTQYITSTQRRLSYKNCKLTPIKYFSKQKANIFNQYKLKGTDKVKLRYLQIRQLMITMLLLKTILISYSEEKSWIT